MPLERKCNQEVTGWLTFDLLPQRAICTLFLPFTFQILSRSLNTQHFHSYCSCKNVLFMGQSDLDPRTIDLILYVSRPVELWYKDDYVVQTGRQNYGTIIILSLKGFCISTRDCKGTTTGLERKWRHVYFITRIWRIDVLCLHNFKLIRWSTTCFHKG